MFNLSSPLHAHRLHRGNAARATGFTTIELMIAVAIVAILASIALPSYSSYVNRSRAKGASSDLVSLGLTMENDFQKTLAYPSYATSTTIAALPSSRTGSLTTDFSTWAPAQGSYFTYSVVSTTSSYTLTATGTTVTSCTLTMTNTNTRTATSGCGFTSW